LWRMRGRVEGRHGVCGIFDVLVNGIGWWVRLIPQSGGVPILWLHGTLYGPKDCQLEEDFNLLNRERTNRC